MRLNSRSLPYAVLGVVYQYDFGNQLQAKQEAKRLQEIEAMTARRGEARNKVCI